jgi:hypothetical protein
VSKAIENYAAGLPDIYRDVLAVFPKVDPGRKMGYGLAFQTMVVALNDKYTLGEIQLACSQLANRGIAEIQHGMFVHPTPLGEEIISCLTGHPIPDSRVPPLSPPPVPV